MEGDTEIIPVEIAHDYTTTHVSSFDYQYHEEDDATVIRGIGRVCGLNRNNSCLLGYKIIGIVLPGLIYHKVLWVERNGKRVFYSDQPDEWIDVFPDAIKNVHSDKRSQHGKDVYYDLTGRPAPEHPIKGLYIQNSRKVMVK